MNPKIASIAIALLVAAAPALAQQSGKSAAPATAKKLHANPAAKKSGSDAPAALTAIPDAQQLSVQSDLVWLGGFEGFSAEEIDKHITDAIRAFQRRNSGKETGVLDDRERALLAQAAQVPQAAAGWRLIDDTATGARLGVPEKLVPRASAARIGSRWTSALGQIQIETFRLHEASLPALFDQEKKSAKRYVGYSALGPNAFVITGEQKLKKFVERVQSSGSEVRGVTILYDQATEGTMAPIAVAVSDSFVGFPDQTAGLALGRRRGVEYGSAVVATNNGDLVAVDDATDQCQSIIVPGFGHADRIAEDKSNNLALLRIYGARNLVPAPLGGQTGAGALTLHGIADPVAQPGDGTVSSAAAQLTAQGLDPAPKLGFSGAAAFDAQGRFTGIVELKPPVVAGTGLVTLGATLVPADAVRAFLSAQGINAAAGSAPKDQSIVRVICVRK
jgi:hypothetical protein